MGDANGALGSRVNKVPGSCFPYLTLLVYLLEGEGEVGAIIRSRVFMQTAFKRIGWSKGYVPNDAWAVFDGIIQMDSGPAFKACVHQRLLELGFACSLDVKVPNRGDGRCGIVSFVATREPTESGNLGQPALILPL